MFFFFSSPRILEKLESKSYTNSREREKEKKFYSFKGLVNSTIACAVLICSRLIFLKVPRMMINFMFEQRGDVCPFFLYSSGVSAYLLFSGTGWELLRNARRDGIEVSGGVFCFRILGGNKMLITIIIRRFLSSK